MTIRRVPLTPEQRQQRQNVSMIPGTVDGRIASASPVRLTSRLKAFSRVLASGAPVISAISFQWDRKVLTAGGAQTWVLTYTPITNSCHVFLNGLELDEGVDYTLSGNTVSLLTAAGATTGDVLWARYAYLSALPNPAADIAGLPAGTVVWEASSLAGIVADGGAVTSWTDDSGTYTLNKQGTGTATFHATGGPNGGPYISFDGNVYFENAVIYPPTMANVFQLLKANAATWPSPDSIQTGGCFNASFFGIKVGTTLFYHKTEVLVARDGTSLPLAGDYDMSPIDTWFVAEQNIAVTATSSATARIGYDVGGPSMPNGAYNGNMVATLWSTAVLSTADRDKVYRWFNQRYGMSCAIP